MSDRPPANAVRCRADSGVGDRRHVPPTVVGQRHAVYGLQAAAGVVAEPGRSGKSLRSGRGGELVVLVVRPARGGFQVVGGIVSEGSAVGVGVRAVGLQACRLRLQGKACLSSIFPRCVSVHLGAILL